jgi:zinc/manganese transport system substrate-binding protein
MRFRLSFSYVYFLCFIIVMLLTSPTHAETKKISVVASFSIIGDLVQQVGGDHVSITMIVGPEEDAHVYQPSPADARKITQAEIIFINGLGFEGWLSRLINATKSKGTVVDLSSKIKARQTQGEIDPHVWQDVNNVKIYIQEICQALIAIDPNNGADYQKNSQLYIEKLSKLDNEIVESLTNIPLDDRRAVSTHDAFGYFSARYGVAFLAPQGVSTEAEASARDIARIIDAAKAQKVKAVFLENVADPRLARRISAETNARLGGTLYSDSLTGAKGDGATYLEMMRHNVKEIIRALKP